MGEFWGPFWIVLTGALAGGACGLLGAYLVLRKMSLLGDALSHAVLPGIAIAFLLSGSRDVLPMFVGAAACGVVATLLIETFHRRWRVQEDTSIGIAFTALFALGVVLITAFAGQVDLDQECVLYGEIAYTPWDRLFWNDRDLGPRPVWILGVVFALDLLIVVVFYKELLIASFDPEMAVSVGISAALFALGVVLITAFAGQVDLDQECVLYGEIAYTPWDRLFWNDRDLGPRPVWILGVVFALDLLIVVVFYKELLIASFDPEMAVSVGISAALMHYVLMGAVSVTTVAAFESVGAILVVALLIVPGASAYLWSDRLKVILLLSALMGVGSAVAGYFLAGAWNSSIAGAMVVAMGAIFAVSLLFAPRYGLLGRFVRRARLSIRVARDHILLKLLRERESRAVAALGWGELVDATTPRLSGIALRSLMWQGLIVRENGRFALAEQGIARATELLRNHRLWEAYLNRMGLPPDHVHDPADALEHITDDHLQREIRAALPDVAIDPQGKRIPDAR